MKNNTLPTVVAKALPAFSKNGMTYNAAKNIFLSRGYTSATGNTYFQALRFFDRLAVVLDVGEGYKYTFLNGIKLFCWNGQDAELIGQRTWGGCNWQVFNENFVIQQCISMLKDYLVGVAKMLGGEVNEKQLLEISREMVLGMPCKRLA